MALSSVPRRRSLQHCTWLPGWCSSPPAPPECALSRTESNSSGKAAPPVLPDSHKSYPFARADLAHPFGRLIREFRRGMDVADGNGCHGNGGSHVLWHLSCCGGFRPAEGCAARAEQHPELQTSDGITQGRTAGTVLSQWEQLWGRAWQLPTVCRSQSTGTGGSFLSLPRWDRFRSRKLSQHFSGHYCSFWELTAFPRRL